MADPTAVQSGQSTTLSWVTQAGTSATITSDQGFTYDVPESDVEEGSTTVNEITEPTTFTLTLESPSGSVTETATIELLASEPPTIADFSVDAEEVASGESVTLTWEVIEAESISIRANGTEVTTSDEAVGDFQYTVDEQTSFVLVASNAVGETTSEALEVRLLGTPSVTSFTATPATDVVPGAEVVLAWVVEDADLIVITDSNDEEVARATANDSSDTVTVTENQTYTLSATNDAGETTETVEVTLLDAPEVIDFMASETSDIVPGTAIDLSWEVTGADTVVIENANGDEIVSSTDATGTTSTQVDANDTYTLTATNEAGEASLQVSVTVLGSPQINDFMASQTTDIALGGTIDLSWDVSDADTVTIENSAGDVLNTSTMATGTYTATVNADETFTLRASNTVGDATRDISVTLLPTPTITTFAATQVTDVPPGTQIIVFWDVSNADTIALVDGSGSPITTSTMAIGSYALTVNGAITITLEATNAGGTTTSMPISISVLGAPTITTFDATFTSVTPGTMVDLSWDVSNADSIAIEDSSGTELTTSTNATGTFTVTVNATETYTLTATNAAGSSAPLSVTVNVPAVVDSFMADTTTSISGGAVVLSWTTLVADSVTITGDQGVTNYTAPTGDIDSGSLTVRPQVSTVYTIEATNGSGSDSTTVTITVDAAPLYITEVFYRAVGADTDLEWVEIYNAGDTFVELANYSVGAGGSDYTFSTFGFSPAIIAPGQTIVVGGPTSSVDNGSPTLDQTGTIMLQNAGSASDGVGLFFEQAPNLTAVTLPVDKVVYGTPNTNNLIDETGSPATELSPEVADGESLVRGGLSDVFAQSTVPQPNLPIFVSSLSVTRGPNESTETFTINGFGFDANLDEVRLGTALLNCTNLSLEELECSLTSATTQTGDVDLTFTRANEYIEDTNGDPVISALATGAQRVYTVPNAFFFEGRVTTLPPSGITGFYCSSSVASPPVVVSASTNVQVTGLLYVQGFTETANGDSVPPGWTFEVGYLTRGDVPYQVYDAFWTDMTTQVDDSLDSDNEHFNADVTSATALLAEAAFRVSPDGGTNWIYCDSDTKNDPGSNVVEWQEGDFVEWQ